MKGAIIYLLIVALVGHGSAFSLSLPVVPSISSLNAYVSSMPAVSSIIPSFKIDATVPSLLPTPVIPSVPLPPAIPFVPVIPSVPVPSLPDIPPIPDISDFDFEGVIQRAQAFYKTLPQTILDDAQALVPELIQNHGYHCETHKVTTPDGYIVTLHRIPYGRNGPSANRPVAYVQHGLLSSSADWLIPGPEKALAYLLADAGYDVWLPNARGTRYSRNHASLDPDSAKFWDFSWHEIAIYDVTTMIDYALKQAQQEKLFYVGHSQGTTVFYVMCSERPEYNDKIRAMFSLAPIAYMSHMTSPLLQVISRGESGIGMLTKLIGLNEFLPNTGFLGRVGKLLCSDWSVTQVLCTNSLFALCGFNNKQMNATLLPIIMGHTPAGAATKQILHYAQEIPSGKFRQYDYGYFGNPKRYNGDPPRYQLNNVTAPVYLYYSRNDWLSGETDVIRLFNELANVQAKFLIPDNKFNHIDYLFGIEARELVYDSLIELMKRH